MLTLKHRTVWSITLVLGHALMTGCKEETSSTTPPPPPFVDSSFTYVVPGTSHQINIIDDVASATPSKEDMTQALDVIPAAHLTSLTTLHFSSYANDIATSLYDRLTPAQRDEWASFQVASDAKKEFSNYYYRWLNTNGGALMKEDVLSALPANNPKSASKWLFMAALFADQSSSQIIIFTGLTALPSKRAYFPYSMSGNTLTIVGHKFLLAVVDGKLSVVGLDGTPVTPASVPSIFVERVILNPRPAILSNTLSSQTSERPLDAGLSSQGAGALNYISPQSPDVYRPVTDSAAQDELAKEIQRLRADPRYILDHAPGTIPHGFSIDSRQAK